MGLLDVVSRVMSVVFISAIISVFLAVFFRKDKE